MRLLVHLDCRPLTSYGPVSDELRMRDVVHTSNLADSGYAFGTSDVANHISTHDIGDRAVACL